MKHTPKLGQHFLRSYSALGKIVVASEIVTGETVLEIGPGEGVLTERLLSAGARVVAIEKDPSLILLLKKRFSQEIYSDHLLLIETDIRDFSFSQFPILDSRFKLVANIPYYLTGEILRQFLSGETQPTQTVLLIQKEVAERIVARDKKESLLSISVKCYGIPTIASIVKRGSFTPPPNVDSAILVIKNISRDFFKDVSEEKFFKVLKSGFSHKRKLLASNLANLMSRPGLTVPFSCQGQTLTSAFISIGIPEKSRAEELSLESWKKLTQMLEN